MAAFLFGYPLQNAAIMRVGLALGETRIDVVFRDFIPLHGQQLAAQLRREFRRAGNHPVRHDLHLLMAPARMARPAEPVSDGPRKNRGAGGCHGPVLSHRPSSDSTMRRSP